MDILDQMYQHWVAIGVALWGFEKVLEIITTVTPWKWDDNLGVIVGKWLVKLWKQPR